MGMMRSGRRKCVPARMQIFAHRRGGEVRTESGECARNACERNDGKCVLQVGHEGHELRS